MLVGVLVASDAFCFFGTCASQGHHKNTAGAFHWSVNTAFSPWQHLSLVNEKHIPDGQEETAGRVRATPFQDRNHPAIDLKKIIINIGQSEALIS